MAHFDIIQLYRDGESSKLDFNDFIDDPLIKTETYYVDDIAKGDQRKEAITHLKKVISPFANVDIDNETLTFHDKQTVEKRYIQQIKEATEAFQKHFTENRHFVGRIRLKDSIDNLTCGDLFFYDGYGRTLSSILTEYLDGYMPETLHIGDIFDAHN